MKDKIHQYIYDCIVESLQDKKAEKRLTDIYKHFVEFMLSNRKYFANHLEMIFMFQRYLYKSTKYFCETLGFDHKEYLKALNESTENFEAFFLLKIK